MGNVHIRQEIAEKKEKEKPKIQLFISNSCVHLRQQYKVGSLRK